MPRIRRMPLFLALVCVASVAAGCASPSEDRSVRIVLAESQELGGYNPVAGYGELGVSPLYDGLLRPASETDTTLPDLVPALAVAEPVPLGERQWRMQLRPGVTFSDGSSLDSSDVVATYKAVVNPLVASEVATHFRPITDIRVDGADAVVVTMANDADPSPHLLLGIAPSERIEQAPVADWTLNTEPVGTGPYELTSLRPDQAVFTARDDYWGPRPHVRSLVFTHTPDDNTRAQRIVAGEVDGASLPPGLLGAVAGREGITTIGVASADWRGVSLPRNNSFTADPVARTAMNVGVDRQTMIDDVLAGHGRPASTPVAEVYGDAYDPRAQFSHDVDSAAAMLDRAGWRMGTDGVRQKDGSTARFDLLYNAQDSLRRDLSIAFAAAMAPLGVEVRTRGTSWDEIDTRLGTAAVLLGGGETPYSIDSQVYDTLHTRVPDSSPYANPGNLTPPGVDRLLDEARSAGPSPDTDARYREVQQRYISEPSYVFLAFLDHTYAYRDLGWNQTAPILEPHSHGVSWGPWWHVAGWTR
ncbi:peptide/nickel transport system substrate-binding protein [Williamsia muralis]|uniref:Peptide/nickel transport system substrate-binding protein n=2 Tax=Williamsia marianensis TaxID=85044 RepID=A0A495K793_WILMA|nr:peptide/nickel transport system substrate-binding protein [Williamsia muralis]